MTQQRPISKPRPPKSRSVAGFEALREEQLQALVIEPLLAALGFENVRDNKGVGEKGKDIVATKRSDFGRIKLYAVQIKRQKFSGRVDSIDSLGALFHQLIQARDEHVVDPTTNVERSPDACVFITPFPIAPSVWERFHKLSQEAYRKNIEIVDGSALIDLVRQYIPECLAHLEMDVRYRQSLERALDRIPESSGAFSLQTELAISKVFVELSLDSVGEFFDALATGTAHTQGAKRVAMTTRDMRGLRELAEFFAAPLDMKVLGNTMPKGTGRTTPKPEKPIVKGPREKLVELNLDSLVAVVQSKARSSLIRLSEAVRHADAATCTGIATDFISIQRQIRRLDRLDAVMNNWVHLVKKSETSDWQKPSIRVPSRFLNRIDCNKYILGAPGAGKTTLLRFLARELAAGGGALPVFVPLLSVGEPSRSMLVDRCVRELAGQGYVLGEGEKAAASFLERASRGEFHLFLDGLDECGSRATGVLKVIEGLSEEMPNLRIVLSGRSTFDLPSFQNALGLQVLPFSREQLSEFLDKWFTSKPTTALKLKAWLNENVKIRNAARNPMVAALLCSLYHLGADLPTTEFELYERRFELLLGKWEVVKGIGRLTRDASRRYWRFLSDLALWMHRRELRLVRGGIAVELASGYFSRKRHGRPEGLVRDCIQRGVLEYESEAGLSFGHLTYQEYLVARRIAADNDYGLVLANITSAWWRNVARLFAAMKEDITSLVGMAIESECNSRELQEVARLVPLAPFTDKYRIEEMRRVADFEYGGGSRQRRRGGWAGNDDGPGGVPST
jgi:hypothetical protein